MPSRLMIEETRGEGDVVSEVGGVGLVGLVESAGLGRGGVSDPPIIIFRRKYKILIS